MSDALWCGRKFRTFNLLDDFNREALGIEIDLNLPARRVVRVLNRVAEWRGYPEKLRVDNGPELTSVRLAEWAEEHGVELEFIQPGKPTQNSFVERFNRTYRNEVLSAYVFESLSEVRRITEKWLIEYNEVSMRADTEVRHVPLFRQGWIILFIGSWLVIIAIFFAMILNVRPVDIFDETSKESAGKLVSISAVPTSWNEGTKSIVTTDRGYFIVRGYISAYTGDPVEIVEHTHGSKYLCVRVKNCKRLVGM